MKRPRREEEASTVAPGAEVVDHCTSPACRAAMQTVVKSARVERPASICLRIGARVRISSLPRDTVCIENAYPWHSLCCHGIHDYVLCQHSKTHRCGVQMSLRRSQLRAAERLSTPAAPTLLSNPALKVSWRCRTPYHHRSSRLRCTGLFAVVCGSKSSCDEHPLRGY